MANDIQKQVSLIVAEAEPQFTAKAQNWLSKHLTLAKALCGPPEELSDSMFCEEIQVAVKQRDYAYYALLMFQKGIEFCQ